MSGEDRNGAGVRMLCAERFARINKRIEALDQRLEKQGESYQLLLVELRVLQTRVTLYAAAVSVGVSALVKWLA